MAIVPEPESGSLPDKLLQTLCKVNRPGDFCSSSECRGRLYTLVCTKTNASYAAACLIHRRDTKNLTRITKLLDAID